MGERPDPDPVPGWIAAIDQAKEGLPMVASYVRAAHQAFMEAGFSDEQSCLFAMQQWRLIMENDDGEGGN